MIEVFFTTEEGRQHRGHRGNYYRSIAGTEGLRRDLHQGDCEWFIMFEILGVWEEG